MLVVVLDYRNGSVHFHKVPDEVDTTKMTDDVEIYLCETYGYSASFINWMEVKESRSCNSCKTKHCDVKRVLVSNDQINPDYFHCNDWEPKNDI